MKKIYFLLFTLISTFSFAQGTETFDGFSVEGNSYVDGTFTGQDGSTWTYSQCRADYEITGQSIMIGRNRTPQAEFSSGLISGGVGTISFNYMQAFGTAVNLNVLVNDVVVGNVTSNAEQDVIKASGTITVNQPGDVVIKFINAENSAGQVAVDDVVWTAFAGTAPPSISITSPSDNSALAPGTTSVNLSINVQNFNVGATTGGFDGHIHWTINGTAQPMKYDTNDETLTVADGQSYTVFMQLVDNSHTPITPAVNTTTTFSVASINQVANITELRAGTLGETYELTGEAIISYIVTDGNRNQKYIQDGGAGILIDDSAGMLTTSFSNGDGITGLKGQLTEFSGTLQFNPSQNIASASSTGNTLTPIVVSVSDLLNNGENFESRLIIINSATFAEAGVFTDNTNYNISNGADATICRVAFGDEDLIGTAIPTGATSITGLGGQFGDDYQIFPRYASDIAAPLSVNNYNANAFSLYPNPTNTGSVSISSSNSDAISVQVFDILGKQVKNQTLTNNTLNVANLKSGIYIVKITQNNTSTTKKLVIK
ncbi:T9SS type A sorting domain-containing protein [Winogradskyella thalassocola]|uniref:Por secretion system C-terminal sorting domain-containing protein n=1 Tax=Winogradskyella thalassocola TaxID=262004 RepID=A0A1G7XY43_9FLAO|nr:T9SS type A sorting domain-containing protein [Winogradskyella thalassocola]SDG89142.1 Por secretion system C-terminal sorting domain-containing protein [Winogradskyella thalassocola]